MTEPTVCAVLLTRDRAAMAARAVESFRRQAYERKWLLILDTSHPEHKETAFDATILNEGEYCERWRGFMAATATIGALRNEANKSAVSHFGADIIAHFDDDDWSHPNRLAEQVALLQSSGAECVGYNEGLFWETDPRLPWLTVACECGNKYPRSGAPCPKCHQYPQDRAWLYRSPNSSVALGATLCYWRSTWERKHFADVKHGEDTLWQTGLRVKAVSAIPSRPPEFTPTFSEGRYALTDPLRVYRENPGTDFSPRFIAHIHGANTCSAVNPACRDWRRVPEWDAYCERTMKL